MGGAWLPELELPGSAMMGDSLWSKAMTPSVEWGRTPSSMEAASPPEALSPVVRSVTPMGFLSGQGGLGSSPTGSMMQPQVIPMYVTVPLAMAHCCPHCHKHFALHPDTRVPVAPTCDTTQDAPT